ncbi:hypothetical protein B0I37DRAFT_446207 [Chaetomium sp. MPI-CAGE-AT-0009]|nr:hypothetical protein B0I37DRAFT_446207 [Chaetomium sp. MPI-CAGE-AT-0009]
MGRHPPPYRFDLHGRPAAFYDLWGTVDKSVFHGLLLSCRSLHAEAAALVYSANWFVVLNQASCHQLTEHLERCCLEGLDDLGAYVGYDCKQPHGHELPLLSPAASGSGDEQELATAREILREWHAAASHLAMVTPGRLTLSMVCDIDPRHPQALHISESVVEPIRLLPPSHLKDCNIRLAKTADRRLQQVARDAVSHACVHYTDLVTPRREVTWSRQEPKYTVFSRRAPDTPDDFHGSRFFACSLGTWTTGGPPTHGCFCRRRHAAFTLSCQCWAPPGPLFLICRALYKDAQFVFFSSNRFVIYDFSECPPWKLPVFDEHPEGPAPTYPYHSPRLAASQFLRDVVPTHSLAHLRFVELVFPSYRPPTWPETQHPAMQDWRATVAWLRRKINPPALTLRLVVLDHGTQFTYRGTITADAGDVIMKAYMDLLEPLVPLAREDGLGQFYARLAYPWKWTKESIDRHDRREDPNGVWLWLEEMALKKRAESYVMGARYEDLYANGRKEPEPGDWNKRYYLF